MLRRLQTFFTRFNKYPREKKMQHWFILVLKPYFPPTATSEDLTSPPIHSDDGDEAGEQISLNFRRGCPTHELILHTMMRAMMMEMEVDREDHHHRPLILETFPYRLHHPPDCLLWNAHSVESAARGEEKKGDRGVDLASLQVQVRNGTMHGDKPIEKEAREKAYAQTCRVETSPKRVTHLSTPVWRSAP